MAACIFPFVLVSVELNSKWEKYDDITNAKNVYWLWRSSFREVQKILKAAVFATSSVEILENIVKKANKMDEG